MYNKNIFIIFLLGISTLLSCQKDLDVFVPDATGGPDSTWYNDITTAMPVSSLKEELRLPVHSDSFGVSTTLMNTSSGLQCVFQGSLVNTTGSPVTGNILLETYLLKKKGDMIRMGTPTTSNGSLLVSGGELFVRVLKDGNEVELSQGGSLVLTYGDSGTTQMMKLFYGDASDPFDFNWLPNVDTFNRVTALSQTYQVITNRLQWINCDYFYDTANASQTVVSAVLPSNYTNANTMAYIAFGDMRSVVGMTGDATTRKFSSRRLPVNRIATMVVISKQGNDYFLGHQQFTTNLSGTSGPQEITLTPVISSLGQIKTYLDTL